MSAHHTPGGPTHALNNLLGKIIGSAELALDRVRDADTRGELEAIIAFAEEAGAVVLQARPRTCARSDLLWTGSPPEA